MDFFITVKVLAKVVGSASLFRSAIGTEQTSREGTGEYRRKVRIGAQITIICILTCRKTRFIRFRLYVLFA